MHPLVCAATEPAGEPARFNVQDYGVIPDGETLNTEAIQALIDQATADGGGTVYFPPGRYLTGTIFLKSHVTLRLENGAVILGSLDINDYVPVGEEKLNHSARQQRHLIYAGDAKGIAIVGQGVIDGRGPAFWPEDFRNMSEVDIRAAMTQPDGFSTRPGTFVVVRNCTDVWIRDVIFRDSPHHMLKVLESRNVVIHGISIEQGIYEDDGPNTDGLAVSGRNIRISDCAFTTGDDCVVIGGTEHLVMSNCTFTTTESAIVISGLRNGTISNCSILDAGGAFTIRPGRGGVVEHVTISNISYRLDRKQGGNLVFARVKPIEVRYSVQSWADRWGIEVEPSTEPAPVIRNLSFSDIVATADGGIFLDGLQDQWIEDITFDNIRFHMRGGREKGNSAEPPHPFGVFGHHSAPYDIFCRYIRKLRLRDVVFTWETPESPEWGSAIRLHHGEDIQIKGFDGRHAMGSDRASVELRDVAGATIRDCRAATDTGTFLAVAGNSKDIALLGNDLRLAATQVKLEDDLGSDVVTAHGNIPIR